MAVKGTFKDISFIELLQLMNLSRKTGRLEVSIENKWAMIIFREGIVWHVEPRGFRGVSPEEVLYTLVGIADGNFVFQRLEILPALERTVHASTESLILEGSKRLDDQTAFSQETGGGRLSHALRYKAGGEDKVRYVPQKVKRVLQAINGQRTIEEVIKESQLDPTQAAQIVKDLIAQEVIESVEIRESVAPIP